MPVRSRFLVPALAIVAAGAAAAFSLTASASAAGPPPGVRPAEPSLHVHLTGPALATAADRCATWATDAGFTNDGDMSGALTTAVAVALYESGCNPAACLDDTLSKPCTRTTEVPGDSIDRGAWQLNNKTSDAVPDSCAYNGLCAAKDANVKVSAYGTYFARWVSYSNDRYTKDLLAAQNAVNTLRQGTVTSALIGTCLGFTADRSGGKAETANCATRASQIWRLSGSTLRTAAGLCLAATARSRTAVVELAKCSRSSLQSWQVRPGFELYNPGAGRCLADTVPKGQGGDLPGVVLKAARCASSQGEGWFKP
jgi:hypothetical protein